MMDDGRRRTFVDVAVASSERRVLATRAERAEQTIEQPDLCRRPRRLLLRKLSLQREQHARRLAQLGDDFVREQSLARALAVDRHRLAILTQLGELVVVLDQEALDQEWRVEPGTIEVGHEHADPDRARFQLDQHGSPRLRQAGTIPAAEHR